MDRMQITWAKSDGMIRASLFLAFLCLFAVGVSTVKAQDCDCSCEGFETTMQKMKTASFQERSALYACTMPCAGEWAKCQSSNTSRKEKRSSSAEEKSAQRAQAFYDRLGKARSDLERFHGVYGDPEDSSGRDFFVAPAARHGEDGNPGYLMVGTMWGDVANWFMGSEAELRFSQRNVASQQEPIEIEFRLDPGGEVSALRFLSLFDQRGWLERKGDLPDGW